MVDSNRTSIDFLIPGSKIREYEIIERVGRGGMATVYKARHTILEQIVAIKIMDPLLTHDPKFRERFLKEAKTQAKLSGHPNIVTIHNFIEEQGLYFIIMEFIEGMEIKGRYIRTLSQLINSYSPLEIDKLQPIVAGILDGLGYAHEKGVIHRDIKPSNIMFTTRGISKISDFGIVRILDENTVTHSGTTIGTPAYMSPEQILGKKVDQRSDIYSFGATIYEALTGKIPFEGDTDYIIKDKHVHEIPEPPKKFNHSIPDLWNDLILQCLAKNPEERPQTTKQIMTIIARPYRPPPQEPDVKVPDLVGLRSEKALAQLEKLGLKWRISYTEGKDGYVLAQDKSEGILIKRGSVVEIVIGKGKKEQKRKSRRAIFILLFFVFAIGIFGLLYIAGKNREAPQEPQTVTMPLFQNLSLHNAEKIARKSKIFIKVLGTKESSEIDSGLIAEQTITEGRTVKIGDTVGVIMSKGRFHICPNSGKTYRTKLCPYCGAVH